MIKLSGYKILKKIGSGGMGDVYLAEHEKLEKKVAIKSLHKNLAADTSFRERFSQEAKTHSKLDHPNIVKLLDYKEQKDGLFLIMEYVDGKQLDEHIKKVSGPIPEKELVSLFGQIVNAISHAHKKGLVHRDIKPANVIISNGKIKVLDFGIAKDISIESGLTKTGVQVGTVAYMSPEQVNAEKIDKLTDIYSLGVTLFYMAVGKPPYENSNAIKMGIKIISEPFPDPKDIYPSVSDKISTIIHKATQKKKTDRYQSCEEFKKDLDSKKVFSSKISETSTKKKVVKKKNKLKIGISIVVSIVFLVFGYFLLSDNHMIKITEPVAVDEKGPEVSFAHKYYSQEIISTIDIGSKISCTKLSPDNKIIAVGDASETVFGSETEEFNIHLFNANDYENILQVNYHKGDVEGISFSPDSKKMVSCDSDGDIYIWDLLNSKLLVKIETSNWVHNVKFSNSGEEIIAIQGFKKIANMYDLKGRLIYQFNVGKQINDFEINRNTNEIYFGCHDEIQIWSLISKEIIQKRPFKGLMCMKFDKNFSKLAIGARGDIIFMSLVLKELNRVSGHFKPILSLDFNFDNSLLISGSSDQTVRIWDVRDLSSIKEIIQLTNEHKGTINAVSFISSNSANNFITGGESHDVKIWGWKAYGGR